jgi:hypoxanthine phosphoribosyltransferase
MDKLEPVLSASELEKTVERLAGEISRDFAGQDVVLVGVLKGAFIFLADLARRLTVNSFIDFVRVASYGKGMESSGRLELSKDVETDLAGKNVIIVEDILDTGLTIEFLKKHLATKKPLSVSVCAMIDKTERRQADVCAQYTGHKLEQGFLVGYGLDWAEKYRCLPGIYCVKP